VRPSPRALAGLGLLVLMVSAAGTWWTLKRSAQLGGQVAALARPGDIRMLSSETCTICDAARQWFTVHGIPFSECSIEHDAACRADFQASGAPGTPLLRVRGQALVGFAPEHLLAALDAPARP